MMKASNNKNLFQKLLWFLYIFWLLKWNDWKWLSLRINMFWKPKRGKISKFSRNRGHFWWKHRGNPFIFICESCGISNPPFLSPILLNTNLTKKGTTANSRSNWFRFQRSPPASTTDAKADDCTGNCTWAGMTTKQRKTAMYWNSYKNSHLIAPDIWHTLDNFPNFSLIYLAKKTCHTSFFWYCFEFVFFCLPNYLCYYFKRE